MKKVITIIGIIILFAFNFCFGQITAKDMLTGMSNKSLVQINEWMGAKEFKNLSNKPGDNGSSEIWFGYGLNTEEQTAASTADIWCIVSFSHNNIVTKIIVYFVDNEKLFNQIKNGLPSLGFISFESKLNPDEVSATNYENTYYKISVTKSNYLSKQNFNFTMTRRD